MQGLCDGQGSCLRQAAKPSPINGTQSQFFDKRSGRAERSCKKTNPLDMWDVKGNCAKGRSKEALQINRELDNIKAQIIKHYQHLSDREATPFYRTSLWNCKLKLMRNDAISREKTTLFLNLCSGIIITSIFLIIFAHRTPNAGQK